MQGLGRVLEDDLDLAPKLAQGRAAGVRGVLAAELHSARTHLLEPGHGPTIEVLPQPDSPAGATISPVPTKKLTPSAPGAVRGAAAGPLPTPRAGRAPAAARPSRCGGRARARRRGRPGRHDGPPAVSWPTLSWLTVWVSDTPSHTRSDPWQAAR